MDDKENSKGEKDAADFREKWKKDELVEVIHYYFKFFFNDVEKSCNFKNGGYGFSSAILFGSEESIRSLHTVQVGRL